ncbi:MAG: galactose oxidase-like domain-containing protein [Armatimonadota bacterium]
MIAPPNANHAPPGHYMLFVTDNTGSYSRAAMVHLSAT